MQFEGEFSLPGAPDTVMRQLMDVERVARCVPGAQLDGRDPDGSYRGAMVVVFGPKRIKFNGKVYCEFDALKRAGKLRGRGVADMRAARFAVITTFRVQPALDNQSTVTLESDLELSGVLATIAGTGATLVGNALMQEFARNLIQEFSAEPDAPRPGESEIGLGGIVRAAFRLLWTSIRLRLSRLAQ